MAGGRKRIPMEKRELEGTVRASKLKRAAGSIRIPVLKIIDCPDLTPEAKKHWPFLRSALQALPVSTMADMPSIQRMAETYAEVRMHQATLQKTGYFYKAMTKEGYIIRSHPAVAALSDADRRLRPMLAEFGLTPASRTRVKGDSDGNPPEDPLADFGI